MKLYMEMLFTLCACMPLSTWPNSIAREHTGRQWMEKGRAVLFMPENVLSIHPLCPAKRLVPSIWSLNQHTPENQVDQTILLAQLQGEATIDCNAMVICTSRNLELHFNARLGFVQVLNFPSFVLASGWTSALRISDSPTKERTVDG